MLPLSVYGAVAMAHSEVAEEYSSPFQFFFYLYDKRNVSELVPWFLAFVRMIMVLETFFVDGISSRIL